MVYGVYVSALINVYGRALGWRGGSTGSMEGGGCSDGEQEDEAEGEGVTASLPRSVGTLPWLSGGGGLGLQPWLRPL